MTGDDSSRPTATDAEGGCPVCSGLSTRASCRLPSGTLHRCTTCGFTFYRTPNAKHDARERYTSALYSEDPYFEECNSMDCRSEVSRDFRRILTLIHSQVRHPGRILDVGSGSGLFLAYCSKAGWDTTGIDLNGDLVRRARAKFGVAVEQGTLADLRRRKPAPFDVITFLDVLEHFQDPAAQLVSAVGLLKPRGVVAVAVPNAGTPINWLARFLYSVSFHRWVNPMTQLYPYPEHLNYFTPATLHRLLQKVGLQPLLTRSYSRSHEIHAAPIHLRIPALLVLKASAYVGWGNKMLVLARKGA